MCVCGRGVGGWGCVCGGGYPMEDHSLDSTIKPMSIKSQELGSETDESPAKCEILETPR